MSDLQLAIRISADGKQARAEIVGLAGDVSKLGAAGRSAAPGVGALGSGMDKLSNSGRTAEGQIKNTVSVITGRLLPAVKEAEQATAKGAKSFDSMGVAVGRMVAAFGGAAAITQAVRSINDATDRVALMDARLKLVSNSSAQFKAVQSELYQQSQSLGTEIEGQTALYVKLARATEGTGRASRDLLNVTKTIGQGLRISGASAQEQSSALFQLAQGMASGRLQGEELRSVLEGMPVVATAVEKSLGLARGGLREFAAQGKLTTDVFIDAVLKIKDFDAQAAALPQTFGQSMTRLSNAVLQWASNLSKATGITDAFTASVNSLVTSIDRSKLGALNGTNAGDIAAYEDRIQSLERVLKTETQMRDSGLGFLFSDDEYKQKAQELDTLRVIVEKLKTSATSAGGAADPLAEGFGKMAYDVQKVGRSVEDTIGAIVDQAKKGGADIAAALAVAGHESQFRHYDKKGNVLGSSAGPSSAKGIYQIIDGTASGLGVDNRDPFDNIRGGIKLIEQLRGRYDSLAKAVTAYYIGEKELNRMLKERGSINLNFVPKGNTTSVGAYLADVEKRFNEFKKKYPSGLEFWDEKTLDQQNATARRLFDQQITSATAAADAQKTLAKSALAVDLETLDQRRAAYQGYVKSVASELRGDQRIQFLQQSAETERRLIEQSTALKQRALDLEEQATRAKLDGVNKEIASAGALQRTEQEQAASLEKRKSIEADLASLASQRQSIEVQASGEIVKLNQETANASAQEAQNIREAAEARKEYADNIEAQIRAIQTGNAALAKEAELHKLTADMTKDDAKAWESNTQARLTYLAALKKAQDDQQKHEKAVREEQLRMNAVFEDAVKQAREFSDAMTTAFDNVGEGIGGLVTAFANYNQRLYQVQRDTQNSVEAGWRTFEQSVKDGPQAAYDAFMAASANEEKARNQEMLKTSQYQVAAFGDMAQAARGFFKEGSDGYNAMTNAMRVLRAVEAAFTLASIAESFIRGQAKATEAVANQASGGDVYSAFPRMAAMAAAMAAIGFSVAGASGGSSGAVAKSGKSSGGTILGDPGASSDSLRKALETVADNSSTNLSYSAGMLRSLQNIEYAMAGVTNNLLRNVNATSGIGNARVPGKPAPFDPLLGAMGVLTASRKISDYGIGQLFAQTLNDVLKQGFQGKAFTDITTTVKTFGITLSSYTKTYISDLPTEVEREFTRVIAGIADSIKEAGKAFSLAGEDVMERIGGVSLKFDATSLKGLKGTELQDAVEAQFSKMADQLSAALRITGLEDFQRAGEGLFSTLVRLADGINTANAKLSDLGISAIKYSEIQYKQGDVAAEIIRQSIVSFEGLSSGIGKFMEEATGSADDLVATYRDLLASRDILKGLGLGWQDLNRTMTQAAGGVAELLSSLESFRDNFFNSGQQYATQLTTLAREFGNLGLKLPNTKDEFRALAESIDTSTAAGAELFARIIKLSDAFAEAADRADELERKYRSYTDPFADFSDRIQGVIDDFEEILSGRLGAIESKYSNQAALAKQQVNSPLQAEISRLGGILGTRQGEVAAEYASIAQAQSRVTELQDMINRAMASGNAKLAGYVRAWMGEIDSLNGAIDAMNSDVAAKTRDIESMNRQIADLQAQIAQNSADIDVGQLSDKLQELTDERDRILREQGDALVQTMKDVWEEIIGVIEDAQDSIRRQIAELQGPRAVSRLARDNQREALADLRQYQRSGGNDPAKIVELVGRAQDAIMEQYNSRLEALANKLERERAKLEREITREKNADIRDVRRQQRIDTREINRGLNQTTREINQGARADTRAAEAEGRRRIREIERAAADALEAFQKQTQAKIDAITESMNKALDALALVHEKEMDALQDAQDARMDALQDEQQKATKILQKRHQVEMDALQKQLSTAQQLKQAYQQIADYARTMKVGQLSTLSPQDQVAEAQRQFMDLLSKSRSGDAEAASKLTGGADTYLQLAEKFFGRGTQFDAIFRGVQASLESVGNLPVAIDPVEAAIEALQESQEAELAALQKVQQQESKDLQRVFRDEQRELSRQQQKDADALRKTFDDRIERVRERAQKIEERMQRDTDRQVAAVERETTRTVNKIEREADKQILAAEREANKQINAIERAADRTVARIERDADRQIQKLSNMDYSEEINALKQRTIEKLEDLDLILQNTKSQAAGKMDEQIAYLRSLDVLNRRQLRQLIKMAEKMGAGTVDVPAFASGGVAPGGVAWVGERGPEPVFLPSQARVVSNSEARQALSASDTRILAALEAVRKEVQALVRTQAAANPALVAALDDLARETAQMRRDAKIRPVAKV